jgi:hypothetical protein
MVSRCHSKVDRDYARFGGRGIRVSGRWMGQAGFWVFLQDMGRRPSAEHVIARIDTSGHYEPGNCKWVTWLEVNNHGRTPVLIEVEGVQKTAGQWAREMGLPRHTIPKRLEYGWHPTAAVRGLGGEGKTQAHVRLGLKPAVEHLFSPAASAPAFSEAAP